MIGGMTQEEVDRDLDKKRVVSRKRECAGCAEALAKQFHETYERLAPQFGYETREETRQFQSDSTNGRLMIAVCQEILKPNA